MDKKSIKSEDIKNILLILLVRKKQNKFFVKSDRSWKRKIAKIYLIYLKAIENEKDNKRLWVTEKFSAENRRIFGASKSLIPILRENDQKSFFRFFRMSPSTFDLLFAFLKDRISPDPRSIRESISAKERLEVVLRYLATGDLQFSTGLLFRISEAAVNNFISLVCDEIWEVLRPVVFEEPSEEMWKREASDFENLWHFKNCIGAIDGKLVTMEVFKKLT